MAPIHGASHTYLKTNIVDAASRNVPNTIGYEYFIILILNAIAKVCSFVRSSLVLGDLF